VEALKPKLVQGPDLVVRTTASIEAHDLYLKGRHFWNQRNKEGLARSAALFEQALALDPGYALAHSGLADSCTLSIQYGQTRAAEVLPNARLHALKAVQLDDTLAEGHASLGQIGILEYQWKTAERELRRAIELRPGYATAHHWYALVLAYTGRAAEARAEAEQARQLDPTSMIINNLVAIMLFESRDYGGSLAQARRALEMNPSSDLPRIWIAISCVQLGKFAEALAALDKSSTQNGQGVRVSVLAASGDRVAARKLLAEIEKRFEVDPLPRGVLARAYLTLGERDRALHWLEEAVEERDPTVFSLKVNSDWDSIRSEPRYHKLLKRMNLE
jgi:tetratricopeptide (TPR) repeat protein